MPGMNPKLLKESLGAVSGRGPELVEFFYARLFLLAATRQQSEVLSMFPLLMDAQRDRLLGALVQVVSKAAGGEMDDLAAYLDEVGRNHRMISSLRPDHYGLVGEALLATLAEYAGDAWTTEVAGTWEEAYGLVSGAMIKAMEDDGTPRWWEASVTASRMLSRDVLSVSVQLDRPMQWVPGQSVKAEIASPAAAPAVRRFLTPVNDPGAGTWMEFHVKVIPWGLFSPALARAAAPGTVLRLSSPGGTLRLDGDPARPIAMIAGSTGLSPMLSILARLSARRDPPQVSLFFGARDHDGLYAARELDKMAALHPWLDVTYAVDVVQGAHEAERAARHGNVVDVALQGEWREHDVYVCGPPAMMTAAARRLGEIGIPPGQVHAESYGSV